MQSDAAHFAWVRKRDGRLVPFEADKISRALFAAGEALGQPDAFMARELTDGVLHFLAAESGGAIPTTEQIADLVIKVVRELGQPALAKVFADGGTTKQHHAEGERPRVQPPGASTETPRLGPALREVSQWIETAPKPLDLAWRAAEACLHEYSLREVFARDLIAAQTDGLLQLTGLETPLELAGTVLTNMPTPAVDLFETITEARSVAGQFLVLDGLEYVLARRDCQESELVTFARALWVSLQSTRLQAVLNLNSAVPPPQVEELAVGPLFAAHRQTPEPDQVEQVRATLLEHFLRPDFASGPIRIDWHLGLRDFLPTTSGMLTRLARRALEGAPLTFVYHRPRRPLPLAEGLDRQHGAVLMAVGLHLPRLHEVAGSVLDEAVFLQKLGSLARLALSAGTQKREFLRRHSHGKPALTGGFLLERARLVVVPVGLEALTRAFFEPGMCGGGAALEFARRVVERLHTVLREDGRACLLETCLDGAPGWPLPNAELLDSRAQAAGMTPWDNTAPARSQLRAASSLHAAAAMGTATVLLNTGQAVSAEDITELLRYAWQQTDIVRVRFLGGAAPARQLTAAWAKDAV